MSRLVTSYKMELEPYHPLLQITQGNMELTHKMYGIYDKTRIRESVETIEDWCKKQEHLAEAAKSLHPYMTERLWILARGSVEMTKLKIEKLFTMRGMMPEICLNKCLQEFDELFECLYYVPLPKINPLDNSRILVTQVRSGSWDKFDITSYMRYCFMIGEYRLFYDYASCDRHVVDLQNINISILTKLNPVVLKKGELLCTEGYGTKIKGIHLINAPAFVDKLVTIMKQVLKAKVASRLYVHSTYEGLHEQISKEILPVEYGGDGPSCKQLAEQWRDTLKTKEAIKIIEDSNKLVTDETKRDRTKFNEEYLGMPGSFRTLAVD